MEQLVRFDGGNGGTLMGLFQVLDACAATGPTFTSVIRTISFLLSFLGCCEW